jgi:hypothetical protein
VRQVAVGDDVGRDMVSDGGATFVVRATFYGGVARDYYSGPAFQLIQLPGSKGETEVWETVVTLMLRGYLTEVLPYGYSNSTSESQVVKVSTSLHIRSLRLSRTHWHIATNTTT